MPKIEVKVSIYLLKHVTILHYRAGEKLTLLRHFPHTWGKDVILKGGQFSVHICTMHEIDKNTLFGDFRNLYILSPRLVKWLINTRNW